MTTIQIEFWHVVLVLLAFFGACWAAGTVILGQFRRHIDDNHGQLQARLDSLEKTHRDESSQWHRIERELLKLQADLPKEYVRREDYVLGQSRIEAKLDGLATKWENSQLRAAAKGELNAN